MTVFIKVLSMNFVRLAKFIQFGLKAAIFIALLVVCIVFFMLEAIEKSVQGATWVDDKSVDQGFESPAVVMCPSPPFKPSISESYGFKYPTRDLFNMQTPFSEKYKHLFADKTVRTLFEDFSFDNDLEFRILGKVLKLGDNEFEVGKMKANVELIRIRTTYDGVCHVLQPRNILNWGERDGVLTIQYKKTLPASDVPQSFFLYFVPRNEWQGNLSAVLNYICKCNYCVGFNIP